MEPPVDMRTRPKKAPPHFIDYDTKRKLHDFLALRCKKGDGGLALYDEPYDDEILCNEFNRANSAHALPRHVESLRLKYIGILPSMANRRVFMDTELERRVADLEERMTAIEDMLTSQEETAHAD